MAVLNFIFGGVGILGGLWKLYVGGTLATSNAVGEWWSQIRGSGMDEPPEYVPITSTSPGTFYLLGFMSLVVAVLAIVTGRGYLKQSRKRGYVFGNIYGIAAIILAIPSMALLTLGLGSPAIVDLVYGIMTLILLNSLYRNSFPN